MSDGIVGPDGLPPNVEEETPPEPETKPEPVTILSIETKVCGCIHQKMSDETTRVLLCPPHALEQSGVALQNAGGALIMAAARLLNDQAGSVDDRRMSRAADVINRGRLRKLRGKKR
jgi:hypothetical protein